MARTKQAARRDDEGEGSEPPHRPAKDKGKGVANEPRKKMKLSKDARAVLAAAAANSGALEIRELATQEVESPPRRRFTRSRPSLSGTDAPPTTQSGMKRPRTESESVPLVPLDAIARKVKKLRFVPLEEWYREPRDDRAGKEFYTLL
jgi:hypothetical protein